MVAGVPLGVGGPPAGISFSGERAKTNRTPKTSRMAAAHAVATSCDPPAAWHSRFTGLAK